MSHKILKGFIVAAATLAASVLLGIIGVSRRCGSIMPSIMEFGSGAGFIMISVGLIVSLATSIFILRHFIFFTRVEVVDWAGNCLSDNGSISIGNTKVRPIVIASVAALTGIILIGMGFGAIFDPLMIYVIYISSISFLLMAVAVVIFLFSVVRHKIRRRFAWTASGLFALLAVIIFSSAIPSIKDASIGRSDVTAVTGTVSRISSGTGMLSGPGHTRVIIKGTSGETISLKYSGSSQELIKGGRYTFYYMPNTRLIDKVIEVDNIQY